MRHILLVLIPCLLSACTTTSFEELGRQLDSAIKGEESEARQSQSSQYYSLTINATPSDSTIKIMNIKPKYHHGIQLDSGTYDILVQREGYNPHRQWVHISDSDITKNIVLNALSKQTASASPTNLPKPDLLQSSITSQSDESDVSSVDSNSISDASVARPVQQKKVMKPAAKDRVLKPSETNQVAKSSNHLRSDYRPPNIDTISIFESADKTQDDQPKFNGAYIKMIDEGFFSDTVKLIEMEQKPAHTAKMFRMKPKSSTTITWLLKQPKKYFALEDLAGTITLPVEKFEGIIIKGKHAEFVSLHRAERWVRGYDSDGRESGGKATFFESSTFVDIGQAVYTPMENEKQNIAKISDDSYFIDFKQTPEKGLFICWAGKNFWFFNLV